MSKKIIKTPEAPVAIGPYSQAVKCANFVFTSGQIPIDPASGDIVEGGVEAQTEQVINNLEKVLLASGTSLEMVIKTTVFLKNIDDFLKVNEVYRSFFKVNHPARSCVEVARLPKNVLVEIEAVAYCK